MDAVSVIIVLTTLIQIFNKRIPLIRLPKLGFNYFWEFFFLVWLGIIAIGLKDSPQFLKNFSEWKWILNLYSIYWFLQGLDWLTNQALKLNKHEQLSFLKKLIYNFNPLSIVLLVCFIYGTIGFIFNFDLFKQEALAHGRRFGGPFDDPMNFAHIYGMYCGLLGAFFISAINPETNHTIKSSLESIKNFFTPFIAKLKSGESILLTVWLLTLVSILLSLTRGAWIGVSVSFLVIAFIYNRKIGTLLFSILLAFFIFLMSAWTSFRERVLQAFNPNDNYDSERLVLWKSNWAMFTDHPWLGVGHGDYKSFLPYYFEKLNFPADHFQSHAHNQYLQALSNTGFLGFTFYMFFICSLLYMTYSYYRKTQNPLLLGSLAAQLSFHLGAFTECNFERSKVRLVYLFFAALALSIISKYNINNTLSSKNKKENL